MRRFLMLLAVAAIAGAMYVAEAPGSAQHAGPTWNQFNALKRQVASLSKTLKLVKGQALDADGFIHACLLSNAAGVAPVGLFGDLADLQNNVPQTFGFTYTPSAGGLAGYSTALNVDTANPPQVWFQAVDPVCVTATPASHAASHLLQRAERTR